MFPIRYRALTLLAAAALAACGTVPPGNAQLDQARSAYRSAQADGQVQALAPTELKQAGDALASAEAAQAQGESSARVDQLAYLANQRTGLAQQVAGRKGAEAAVAGSGAERDALRLAARTREADAANASAATATATAASATRDAQAAQRQSAASQQVAEGAQRQAQASQQQAGEAERRTQTLEDRLRELNARKTERGMVVTINDVLFDSGRAEVDARGQNIERLAGFLKQYPQRRAVVEGYTDSTGTAQGNLNLSTRRADAVMTALLGMGVARGQLSAQGYGQTHPVADNDSAGGRQMNRRVEIVLSDERGVIAPR